MEYIATFDDTLELSLIYEDANILEMSIEETVNPGDDFELGAAPSALFKVSLIDVDENIIFEQEVIKPHIGLKLTNTIEYVPLGVFIVDEIKKEKRTIKLTCFDNMVKLEKPYFSELTYPAPLNTVVQEICAKAGVTLATTNLPTTQIGNLSGYTLREAIGFIAAFLGGFARFNRDGQLEITSYTNSNVIITADNYASLDTAERTYSIGKLTCYVGEDEEGNMQVLTAGTTGHEVVFECPIMTQGQLNNIHATLSQLSYMPYRMEWQGNPALMAGDKITIIDAKNNTYNTLLMRQKISYRGGLKATAEAVGKTEQAQATRTIGTLTKSIDRKTQIARTAAEQYADRILKMLADGQFEDGLFIDGYTIYSPIIAGLEGRFLGTVKVGENGQIVIDGANKRIYLNENNYWDETGIHLPAANIVGKITASQLQVDSLSAISANLGTVTAGTLQGVNVIGSTIKTADDANRLEMSSGSLKTYYDSIKRVELDYDSLDFYDTDSRLTAHIYAIPEVLADYFTLPLLEMYSYGGIRLYAQQDSNNYAEINIWKPYASQYESGPGIVSIYTRNDNPDYGGVTGYGVLEVSPGGIMCEARKIDIYTDVNIYKGYYGNGDLRVDGWVYVNRGTRRVVSSSDSYARPTIASTSKYSKSGAWVTWDYPDFSAAPIVIHRDDNNLGTKVRNVTASSCEVCMAGTATGYVRAIAVGGV